MPTLSNSEQIAIRAFLKARDPILCAPGSTALQSLDVSTNSVSYKPILYIARSANRQRVISSTIRGIKIATDKANAVIRL